MVRNRPFWGHRVERKRPIPNHAGTRAKVEIAIPAFGDKNQVSIDRAHGFIRKFTVISAAAHDGAQLKAVFNKARTRAG